MEWARQCYATAFAADVQTAGVLLTQLDAVMVSRALPEAVSGLRWDAYLEDLEDVPADSLDAACKAWRRNPDNKFFPTPGELLRLCETVAMRKARGDRLNAIANWSPRPVVEHNPAVAEGLRDLLNSIGGR
jgi:hypothetical protein